MRLKDYDQRDGKRVWLSEKELQLLIDNVDSEHPEAKAAVILGGRAGLRRKEIVDITPADIVRTDHGQVVRVWEGKGDKYREVPAPDELTDILLGMAKEPDESIVNCDPSTIYDYVQRARERCQAQTRDEAWQFVGPHDLRRSWGVRLLESGVLPSVVMEWGGWEDWQTFRDHYLSEFSPEALRRERGKVSWLGQNGGSSGEIGSSISYAQFGTSGGRTSRREPRG
jgi:integrase